MNAKVRQLVLGGGILAAGGWFAFSNLGGDAPRAAQAAATASASVATPAAGAVAEKPALGIELPDDLTWPADPFRTQESTPAVDNGQKTPISPPDLPRRQFVLKAILDGENPRAIVDGLVVGVGDRLPGGETVAAIEALTVTLTGADGRGVVLQLPE